MMIAMKNNPLSVIGIDTEGRPVIGGLFKMMDTFGLPLSMAINLCVERGITPGLYDFQQAAIKAGWSIDKTNREIREACFEAGFPIPPQILDLVLPIKKKT